MHARRPILGGHTRMANDVPTRMREGVARGVDVQGSQAIEPEFTLELTDEQRKTLSEKLGRKVTGLGFPRVATRALRG